MSLLSWLTFSSSKTEAPFSAELENLSKRIGTNIRSSDVSSSIKTKQSGVLHRELSLIAFVITAPSDEELVEQVSQELFIWHERRRKILYGLCHDAFVQPPWKQPEASNCSTLHQPIQKRNKFIKIHKQIKSSNAWLWGWPIFRRNPIVQDFPDAIVEKREKHTPSESIEERKAVRTEYEFSSLRHEVSLPCMMASLGPLPKPTASKSSPGLFHPAPLKTSLLPPPADPGKLHVMVVGKGPQPVIILHGMVSSANFFLDGLLPRISPSFRKDICTFYIPDMMGYGKSVRILANENYNVAEQASRIYCDVIRQFSLDTYHILGHSYGGMVAVALAAVNPQHVRTLTLLSPAYFESLRIAKQVMQDAPFPCHYITINPDIGRRILHLMRICLIPIVPTITSFIPSTTLTETALRELISTEPEATLGTIETMQIDRIDGWLNVLRQHQLRILILQAEHDVIVPPQQGRKMALKFPNVIYRELRGTGHLFPQSHSVLLASIFEHEILRWTSRHQKKLGDWIVS